MISLSLSAGAEQRWSIEAFLPRLVAMIRFNPGSTHADFDSNRDLIADSGDSALMLGLLWDELPEIHSMGSTGGGSAGNAVGGSGGGNYRAPRSIRRSGGLRTYATTFAVPAPPSNNGAVSSNPDGESGSTGGMPGSGAILITNYQGVNQWNTFGYGSLPPRGAVFNMSGNSTLHAPDGLLIQSAAGSPTTFNFDAGVTVTPLISLQSGAAQLNFNGGTVRATGSVGEYFQGFNAGNTEIKSGGVRNDTNGFDIATDLAFDGVGALIKLGAGKLTLNGITTHTGGTFITAGSLALGATGNLRGQGVIDIAQGATLDTTGSAFALAAGQTLSGDGSVVGNTTLTAGVLAPGAGTASLDFSGDLLLGSALTTRFGIMKSGGTLTSDFVSVSGALTLGGTLEITGLGDSFAPGDTWTLFRAGSLSGNFTRIDLPGSSSDWDTDSLNTLGKITYVPRAPAVFSVVPEPRGIFSAGLASAVFMGLRRRRGLV